MPGNLAGLAPWRMWGSTASVAVPIRGPQPFYVRSQQLANIDYGRPDTWEFFLSAVVVSVNPDNAVTPAGVFAEFDLTIGVGRAAIDIPNFWRFEIPATDPVGRLYFATSVIARPDNTLRTTPNVVDHFTAESIRCISRVTAVFPGLAPDIMTVAVTALFAPRTHVRPEWHQRRFPGGEEHGT